MTAGALAGLALLPAIFFTASFLLPPRLQVLRIIFNGVAILGFIVFTVQLPVEFPTLAAPAAGLQWFGIAILIFYLLIEFLILLTWIHDSMKNNIPQGRR